MFGVLWTAVHSAGGKTRLLWGVSGIQFPMIFYLILRFFNLPEEICRKEHANFYFLEGKLVFGR